MKRNITGQSALIWLAVAAAVGIVCLALCRASRMKKSTAILVTLLGFYMAVIVTFTLGHRTSKIGYSYNLKLFWTIEAIRNGKRELISESIWNMVLFVPLGVLLGMLFRKKCFWLSVVIGAMVSAGVELVQLLWKIGLFEFDDIIYNTAGCLIGELLVIVVP